MTEVSTFTCPRCGLVSHHPKDVEHGYCGNCHAFTGKEVDDLQALVADISCPACQQKTLRIERRERIIAKQEMKFSGHKLERWPWIVCGTQDCEFEEKAKLA